jgi:hypothetical protein
MPYLRAKCLVSGVIVAAAGSAGIACGETRERRAVWLEPPARALRLARPELVAFRAVTGDPPRYELVMARANGQHLRVPQGASDRRRRRPALFERAAWSPDGRFLAFTAELGVRVGFETKSDLFLMRADGSGLRRA